MIVAKKVYDQIDKFISGEPPETGGILGSTDGKIVDVLIMDKPQELGERICSYSPNVDFFNKCIGEWENTNILFKGIFHTHFAGVESLSNADEQYIDLIMRNMPDTINSLYFPVFVLPDRKMVCYFAELKNSKTIIKKEGTFIDI